MQKSTLRWTSASARSNVSLSISIIAGITVLCLQLACRRDQAARVPEVPAAAVPTGPDGKESRQPAPSTPDAGAATPTATTSPPDDPQAKAGQVGLQALQGRWLRPDGNYVMEVKRVDADGTVEAAYHNPRPIRVYAAKALIEDGATKLLVELRDVGYPGCMYHLSYDPEQDLLRGVYFQAAEQQKYDVVFVRMK